MLDFVPTSEHWWDNANGKCSRVLLKSCMASVFRRKGKTFLRNGITTRYIHVASKYLNLSSSICLSKVTLMLQITFIAGWSVTLAHRRLPHCVGSPHTLPKSQQHHHAGVSPGPKLTQDPDFQGFASSGKVLSSSRKQDLLAWLHLKEPVQSCFSASHLGAGRKKGDGGGRMHIVGLALHWQQSYNCPILRQQPQIVANASPVLQQQDPARKVDDAAGGETTTIHGSKFW